MSLRPLLLGHRGARAIKTVPENTIPSFDLALTHGCDGFEFDVRLTADGQAIVCHDPEVRGIEVARAKAQQLAGMPTLEEVLIRYQESAFLNIEIKVAKLEKIVPKLLRDHPPRGGFVVSSFFPEVLCALHLQSVTLPLGLICETHAQLDFWRPLPADYVFPHYKLVRPQLIREIQQTGGQVFVWTVNNPADMRCFVEWGVGGVLSDDTELLVRTLRPGVAGRLEEKVQ